MTDNEKMKGTFDLALRIQHNYMSVKLESIYFIEFLSDFYTFCYGFWECADDWCFLYRSFVNITVSWSDFLSSKRETAVKIAKIGVIIW